jgi:prepilin-type N-terminal cleavage/methylation domain-containing protein
MDLSTMDSMRQRAKGSNRLGFTLAEVLVTVTIIAVLAAVVVPSIGGTLFKGDVGRVSSDMTNLRGGMEQFLADVRNYPGKPGNLTTKILAATQATDYNRADSSAYSALEVTRWKGPYMNAAVATTGFGGTIGSQFLRVDCANGASSSTPWVINPAASASSCVAAVVLTVTPTNAAKIDAAMDDGVSNTGTIRYKSTGTDTLLYLAVPIP